MLRTLAASWSFTSLASATLYCPFLGPAFPAPTSLSTNAPFQASLNGLQTSILDAFATGNSSHGPINPNDTYSIQIFSTSDEQPLLDLHYRGKELAGNSTLDGDSVYRIASVTKLITVYMLLVEAGDEVLKDPVSKHLPELAGKQYYDEITIGSLASYMAGIVADVYGVDGISGGGLGAAYPDAFPPLDQDDISPCAYGQSGCTREVFLEHLVKRRQVYLPNTTPGYSNAAFGILGLVLESITGLSYAESLHNLLTVPLNLNATTASTPRNATNRAINVDEATAGWNLIVDGAGIGMGAMFSTANDMSRIGRAILSSSLIPSNTTRAWMKPTSHTSSLIGAVGHGWEIFRATLGPPEHNRVVDLYTKGGSVGGYGANFVLIPDYDVGVVLLTASRRGRVPIGISSVIVDHLLPALEEAARVSAHDAFAGTYAASNGVNSSLVLSSTLGVPGLTVAEWISNGTNLLQDVFAAPESFQLYPTNVLGNVSKSLSWRASYLSIGGSGPFSACPSWGALDRPTYGLYGVDEFVFRVDESGRATAIEPKALKVVLGRV